MVLRQKVGGPRVEVGGLVWPCIPWRMRRGRRRSSDSGEGRWGSSLKRLWYLHPWGRWGSDSGVLSKYGVVRNRDKLGVSGCIGDGRVQNGSS